MKNLYLLFIICFLNFNLGAQITSSIIKANFGVEADLTCNYFNANQPGNDDWFSQGLPGSGSFVIDTTGAAAIVTSYAVVAERMTPFTRFMRVAPYTTVNNRIWLDAVYHRDFHGTDSTVFAAGSNKNGMSPASWSAPDAQNIPDKNDILDAFTHIRRAGPNLTDSLWMFGAISIENTTGNRYFDFELYQTDIRFDRPTLSFLGYGPDLGHTSWKFDAAGNILTAGDIIFSAEYSSSSLSYLGARIWVSYANYTSITPTAFSWGGTFDGANNGSAYGYASIVPKTAGTFYTGLQSANGVWAGPFKLVRQDNSLVTTYTARQFMEFSINLSKLGLDPGQYGINPCGSPFRRVLIKSRSSTSFTAELKDFIGPFSLFNYANVDAYTNLLYFCGSMPSTSITVNNPNSDLIYNWTTTNGTIVGATTGSTINVSSPGTYYVSQIFDALCPEHSKDSVTILFDPVCSVLNGKFLNLQASLVNKNSLLNWQVANNELAEFYEIEYSLDNEHFEKLVTVPATSVPGIVKYSYTHQLSSLSAAAITYRVKLIEKTGVFKYSGNSLVRLVADKALQPIVFPNPSNGKISVAVKAIGKAYADIAIFDAYGKSLNRNRYDVKKGENVLALGYFETLPSAVYIMKVNTADGESTHKVIIRR